MDSEEHIPTSVLHSHTPFTTANGEEEDHHVHPHSLSRLSMCTSSKAYEGSDDDDDDDGRDMVNSDDGDADEEFSQASSDSDKEQQGSHLSLPTPPRKWRSPTPTQAISIGNANVGAKEYASENEARRQRRLRQRKSFPAQSERRNFGREKWESREESEYTVMTKAKGSRRSLCMDLDEVKACRDLGFELELPSRIAISCNCSAVEANDNTSSDGNSPINSWRISSPGDDPKDVKARLKIWAQAVALASSASTP